MIQSVRQRTSFVHSMVRKLKTALQPHLFRSLSVVDSYLSRHSILNQYLAFLSLRWLIPLLEDAPTQTSLTLMLQLHINNRNSSLYHQIPLLFPQTRQAGFSTERLNAIDMLNASTDCIPRNFDGIHVTPATALSLPLTTFLTPKKKIPAKVIKLIGNHLFCCDIE
ncbi:hypothetical protein BD770DRAFT_448660 [Pilaira anomala]|nr:hypothetical protein BD770DRAFT_448660 [Pilaira anomala]